MQTLLERFGVSVAVSFGLGLLFALVILPAVTHAQVPTEQVLDAQAQALEAQSRAQEMRAQAEERVQEKKQQVNSTVAEKRAQAQARLEGKKLELCQKREEKVRNIISRIDDRTDRQMQVFNKIAQRVDTFYQEKGLQVDNYETLYQNVQDKMHVAEEHELMGDEMNTTFECEGTNPKGMAAEFKDHLKDQIAALKEYRTAVQELIVAVKTAAVAAEGTSEQDTEAPSENETEVEATN